MQKEIWMDVVGYENYYKVSNLGNVKSLDRISTYKYRGNDNDIRSRLWGGHICAQRKTSTQDYLMVLLSLNGKRKLCTVHKLVAMAFLNHIPCGRKLVIDHINEDKLDNNLENLQILTMRENISKSKLLKNKTSKYTGVCWKKKNRKWCASIHINGTRKHLGLFEFEYEAHLAYQKER